MLGRMLESSGGGKGNNGGICLRLHLAGCVIWAQIKKKQEILAQWCVGFASRKSEALRSWTDNKDSGTVALREGRGANTNV